MRCLRALLLLGAFAAGAAPLGFNGDLLVVRSYGGENVCVLSAQVPRLRPERPS
jgi:hypothetical protein